MIRLVRVWQPACFLTLTCLDLLLLLQCLFISVRSLPSPTPGDSYSMANTSVASLIENIVRAGQSYDSKAPGSRETLVDLGHALVAALEIPSEFVQRSMWAEVSYLLYVLTAPSACADQHLTACSIWDQPHGRRVETLSAPERCRYVAGRQPTPVRARHCPVSPLSA